MTHSNNIIDKDPFFEIDDVTRKIVNPASSDIAIVQFDHNSERFTFRLNKDVEGHDMTKCNRIEVHYKNTDVATQAETLGVYEITDLHVDPEDETKVLCTWLISQNATQKVGKLDFLLRFSCVDTDGIIRYAWNTSIFTGITVSAGLYNTEEVLELYADVLEQWKTELFSLSAEGVENINTAKEQALTDIENAMSNVHLLSNSLRGNAIGNSVTLDDVSPLEQTLDVEVKSKNKTTYAGYRKATSQYGTLLAARTLPLEVGKIYTASWDTQVSDARCWYTLYMGANTSKKIAESPNVNACDGNRKFYTFQLIGKPTYWEGTALQQSNDATTDTPPISNFMIEEGEVATSYAPFVSDVSGVSVKKCGKNLIPYPYHEKSKTQNGLTFTDNGDGSITVNGTPTADTNFMLRHSANPIPLIKGKTYTVSGKSNVEGAKLIVQDVNYRQNIEGTAVVSYDTGYYAFIRVASGTVCNNLVFKPQLEIGATATEYELYNPTTYTVNADGTVEGVTPSYPSMTLTASNTGAVVDVEYNRDINKAFAELEEKLTNAVISLGGNV